MKIKELDDFKSDCNKKRCNRNSKYNEKTCIKDYRQQQCYNHYVVLIEKKSAKISEQQNKNVDKDFRDLDNIDIEYEIFKQAVWMRDAGEYNGSSVIKKWLDYDVFWNSIFTKDEKKYIIKNHLKDLHLCATLDIVHIESVGRNKKEERNINNVILGARLFHSLLDQYKDPVTQKDMNNDERHIWLNRMRNYIKEINKHE